MTDTDGSVPGGPSGGGVEDPGSSPAPATDGAVDRGASVDGGSVPAVDGDAQPGADGSGEPAPIPASGEFTFGGRKFRDQAHAEEYFRSQVGRVPDLQRKLSRLEELEGELEQAHRALNLRNAQRGQGGDQPGAKPATPQGFGDELLESGDLSLMAELAESKGIGHALYAMAQLLGERTEKAINEKVEARAAPMERERQYQQHVDNVVGAVKELTPDFAELDESNKSPEALETRQDIMARWKALPPEFSLGEPLRALRMVIWEQREEHGTPVFAVPPGTDASTSARAASAAEAAAGVATAIDDGSPSKPRPSGVPRTAAEQLADDLAEADQQYLKTAGGSSLGVRRVS